MPGHTVRHFLLGIAALAAAPRPCSAALQQHPQANRIRQVSSVPICKTCTITRTKRVTFGFDSASADAGTFLRGVRDPTGRWWVVRKGVGGLQLYDSANRYLGTIGRAGSGPGEYQYPDVPQFGPDGTVYIRDAGTSRVTVLSLEGKLLRTIPLSSPPDMILIRQDGSMIGMKPYFSRELGGLPLHHFDKKGNRVRSFGVEGEDIKPVKPWMRELLAARNIGLGRSGSVWSAPKNRYRMERWDSSGKLVDVLVRDADWFPDWWSFEPMLKAPSPPTITALWEDDRGLLWIVTTAPDLKWKEGIERVNNSQETVVGEDGQRRAKNPNTNLLFDTIVEVIDIKRGALVASTRFPKIFDYGPGNPGIVGTYDEDEDGVPSWTFWDLALEGYSGTSSGKE